MFSGNLIAGFMWDEVDFVNANKHQRFPFCELC